MKPLSFLLLALPALLGSCIIHVNVVEPFDRDLRTFTGHPSYSEPVPGSKVISGRVVDQHGEPVDACVMLVCEGGSRGGTWKGADGHFRFDDCRLDHYDLTATMEDGRIAVVPGVPRGTEDLLVPVTRQGATLDLEMNGRPTARLAVFWEDARVHDFTLRDGEPTSVVVPAGHVDLLLYGDGLERRAELKVSPTNSHEILFEVDS